MNRDMGLNFPTTAKFQIYDINDRDYAAGCCLPQKLSRRMFSAFVFGSPTAIN